MSLGRNSIVGTTVKAAYSLPDHLLADEKHTQWYKNKVYLATTVAGGCILGSALVEQASEAELTNAYREFEVEALALDAAYAPQSVNTDGWTATQNAWKNLFEGGVILLLCFLHAALKIQDRSRRWERKKELMTKVWDCYRAESLASFSQQVRRLREWVANIQEMPQGARDKVLDLCQRAKHFKRAYDYPEGHRTSNMLDRLMDYQDRGLYQMRYLHSDSIQGTGRLFVRAMALLWNFHPYCRKAKRHSPFEDLNNFIYHENWLENLMISASMGGRQLCANKKR